MKSLETYVETRLDYESAEETFKNEICETLGTTVDHIKGISMGNYQDGNKINQYIVIRFRGSVEISGTAISKIGDCRIVTPNTLKIKVGEIHL